VNGQVRLVGEEIAQASVRGYVDAGAGSPTEAAAPLVAPTIEAPVASSGPAASQPLGSQPPAMPVAPSYESPTVVTPPADPYVAPPTAPAASEPLFGGWPFVVQPMPTEVPPLPTAEPTWTPFPTATPPPTGTPDPLEEAGLPVQIDIPAIGVTALVEQVGLTRDGAMDTPKGWMNAAWYSPGFRPGETGNAVIAGHLDSRSGGPAVFWNLSHLQPGDEIMITYERGDRYTFAVQDLEAVPYDIAGPALAAIFGASQTSDLNLITCNGLWDRGKATYTQRLVVYATLLPEKTVHVGFEGSYD
jgi:sortase (surface protein transpeptidase)